MQFNPKFSSNFTSMDSSIFFEKTMSLKTKGLLSFILSLPPNWNYFVRGLVALNKDGRDSIYAALFEAEQYGYLQRIKNRGKNGRFDQIAWDIYQTPQGRKVNDPPLLQPLDITVSQPHPGFPDTVNPDTGFPDPENLPQINTNISSTKLINKSSSADDIKRIIRSVDASLTDNDITAIANQILSIKDSLAGIGNKKAYISRCIETYKHNANIPPQNKNTQPNNKFINFTQRSYDFAELEKEILDN